MKVHIEISEIEKKRFKKGIILFLIVFFIIFLLNEFVLITKIKGARYAPFYSYDMYSQSYKNISNKKMPEDCKKFTLLGYNTEHNKLYWRDVALMNTWVNRLPSFRFHEFFLDEIFSMPIMEDYPHCIGYFLLELRRFQWDKTVYRFYSIKNGKKRMVFQLIKYPERDNYDEDRRTGYYHWTDDPSMKKKDGTYKYIKKLKDGTYKVSPPDRKKSLK